MKFCCIQIRESCLQTAKRQKGFWNFHQSCKLQNLNAHRKDFFHFDSVEIRSLSTLTYEIISSRLSDCGARFLILNASAIIKAETLRCQGPATLRPPAFSKNSKSSLQLVAPLFSPYGTCEDIL